MKLKSKERFGSRVRKSFDDLLERAGIKAFRVHDLRHTFASRYMMNGGDRYELAKILGHSNIKMTERYAKLAKQHIARTSNTAREMWNLLERISYVLWGVYGGQGRNRTADAALFRGAYRIAEVV